MQKRKGILALGNLLVDRTLVISDYPKETMLATISEMGLHCGGGCTNVLFNLSKLDPELSLFLSGAIGKDSEGQFILRQAKKHNVVLTAMLESDLPTSFTDVMINSQNGERTFFIT
ncbi:carbohydrate kinase family protein [Histophilus somni]